MRYFVTRTILGFICLIAVIHIVMGFGYWLNAPILAIDDIFLDVRTHMTYTRPQPDTFSYQQLSGMTLRPNSTGEYLMQIMRDSQGQMVIINNRQGHEIARFGSDETFRRVNALWVDNDSLLLMRQLQYDANQRWSIWHLEDDSERVLGVYDEPAPPSFSPNHQWIIIQPKRDHPSVPMPATIYATQNETVYHMGESSIASTWSADSRWFTSLVLVDDNEQVLQLLDTATGTLYDKPLEPSSMLRLSWSSDSQYLLAHDNSTLRIFHEGEEILVRDLEGLRSGLWSPDDTSILLETKGEEDEVILYLLEVPDGSPRYLMVMPDSMRFNSIQWITNGTGFTYLTETSPVELIAYDFATRETFHITDLPDVDRRSVVQWVDVDFINR